MINKELTYADIADHDGPDYRPELSISPSERPDRLQKLIQSLKEKQDGQL